MAQAFSCLASVTARRTNRHSTGQIALHGDHRPARRSVRSGYRLIGYNHGNNRMMTALITRLAPVFKVFQFTMLL